MFDPFSSSSCKTPILHMDAESAAAGSVGESVSELMRAMILRTIEDFKGGDRLKVKALDYMNSEDDEYILSFQAICKHFGMDPVKTRRAIMTGGDKISTRRRTV